MKKQIISSPPERSASSPLTSNTEGSTAESYNYLLNLFRLALKRLPMALMPTTSQPVQTGILNALICMLIQVILHFRMASDDCIKNAEDIRVVRPKFMLWFNTLAADVSAVILLIAWNGERCYLKWLWKICQAPNSPFSISEKLQYFMDPYKLIASYKSCTVHS